MPMRMVFNIEHLLSNLPHVSDWTTNNAAAVSCMAAQFAEKQFECGDLINPREPPPTPQELAANFYDQKIAFSFYSANGAIETDLEKKSSSDSINDKAKGYRILKEPPDVIECVILGKPVVISVDAGRLVCSDCDTVADRFWKGYFKWPTRTVRYIVVVGFYRDEGFVLYRDSSKWKDLCHMPLVELLEIRHKNNPYDAMIVLNRPNRRADGKKRSSKNSTTVAIEEPESALPLTGRGQGHYESSTLSVNHQ